MWLITITIVEVQRIDRAILFVDYFCGKGGQRSMNDLTNYPPSARRELNIGLKNDLGSKFLEKIGEQSPPQAIFFYVCVFRNTVSNGILK